MSGDGHIAMLSSKPVDSWYDAYLVFYRIFKFDRALAHHAANVAERTWRADFYRRYPSYVRTSPCLEWSQHNIVVCLCLLRSVVPASEFAPGFTPHDATRIHHLNVPCAWCFEKHPLWTIPVDTNIDETSRTLRRIGGTGLRGHG